MCLCLTRPMGTLERMIHHTDDRFPRLLLADYERFSLIVRGVFENLTDYPGWLHGSSYRDFNGEQGEMDAHIREATCPTV